MSGPPGRSLGAAPGGHDRQVGLVEAHPDVVGGDPDVGGHRDLDATAQGMTVERGDDRSGKGGDPVAQAAHADGHRDGFLVSADLRKLLEVATGDEGAVAAAAQHHDVGVGRGVQGFLQCVHGRRADRVADTRAVDGYHRDAFIQVERKYSVIPSGVTRHAGAAVLDTGPLAVQSWRDDRAGLPWFRR